jgi:biotin carboxylase
MRLADESYSVSTADTAALIEFLAGRDDIEGVVSPASDVNLPSQYLLARRLGLPCGLSAGALRASVDKGFFRDLCDRLGQAGPRYVQGTPEQVRVEAATLDFPLIVKPADSSGGRGIGVCARPEDLSLALSRAQERSPSGVVIAEEQLTGSHHAAEAVVRDGRVALLAVGDRTLTPPPYFVTVEHRMPSGVPGLAERVRTLLDDVCAALDYRWGSLNVDILVRPDREVVLVELGARLGGNGSAELLGLVHGLDVTEAYVRMAVGDTPDLTPRGSAHAAFRVLTSDGPGKLTAIHGAADVRALPGVVDLVLAAQPGDHVEPYHRAGAKLGYVLATAPGRVPLESTLDRIRELLTLEVATLDWST